MKNKDVNDVTVILSTYNGEKYISELLDSIDRQKDVNVKVYVRDDGSSDLTINILKARHQDNLILSEESNIGASQSFLKALKDSPDSQYYAYCDQDDIWYENKLITGISKLSPYQGKPALYMSTYDVVDKNLNKLFTRDMEYEREITLEQTLLCRAPSGCTMIFNKELRDIIISSYPDYVRMHDFWTLLVAEAIGAEIITDDFPSLMYRQHDTNTVGLKPKLLQRIKRLYQSSQKHPKERSQQARDLLIHHSDLISAKNREYLTSIADYDTGIINKFKLINNNKFRWNKYTNLLFIVSVLSGKF